MADAWARTLENSTALAVHSETLAYALAFENPKLDLGNRFKTGRQAKQAFEDKFASGHGSVAMVASYSPSASVKACVPRNFESLAGRPPTGHGWSPGRRGW